MQNVSSVKQTVGLVIAAVIVIAGLFLPGTGDLTHEGILGLAILLATVALWICESIPMGVAGLLALVVAPIVGIAEINTVFSGFGTTTVIFAIAVFGLTAIVMKSNLAIRLTATMTKWSGPNSNKLVLAFMCVSWLLSTVMNDSAVLVLVIGLSMIVINNAGHKIGESHLAKALYIGIALCAFIGGGATPAGSSINVLVIGMLEQTMGQTISFVDWMVACMPVCLLMVPITWFAVVKILKPEPIEQKDLDELQNRAKALGPLVGEEKKTLFFLIAMPVLWIAGSWIPALNVTTVTVLGLAAMFLPGIKLLTFEEFQREVPWTIVIMIGAVLCLGGIVNATGGVAYLANMFLSTGVTELGGFFSLLLIMLAVYAFHTLVPIGPAFITLLVPPLMAFCVSVGMSPAVPGMMLAILLSGNFLLPFNPGMALAYRDNCWTASELFKTGIIPAIIFVVLLSAWTPFASGLLGIAM
ncbi:SLC13 family permease [Raoultibacter timonensis]|uniref:Sodium-dependent dicarboxylate transporter SdcS n=1 Tax=Raoultibacter timonensis TaxID=1907662 RepID=A0ABM7WK10_9ACTN|nr:SLC13 family permease [Raoultibacter timonensis]BDE96689.1 transporter [Raoultibacter timonensis]BDF51292.1 transporter [Raoultibacter timonensis]